MDVPDQAAQMSDDSSERHTVRAAMRAALAMLIVGAGCSVAVVAWLLRDPEPIFASRRGALVSIDTLPSTTDGATSEQEVHLVSSSGLRVVLAVRRPASASLDERRQLFLALGGQQRGRASGALVGDTRGAVIASLEYPFDGDRRAKGVALVAQVPAIRRAFYDTPPAVSIALDYLLSRADVDPTRVELVGASFGAPFATIAAARDSRVSRLWIVQGGGRPFAMIDQGLKRDVPLAVLRWPLAGIATLLASGPRLAPERWIGRVAPRPVFLLSARDDERIPRASADALWAAAREPRERIWLPGAHLQGDRPDVMQMVVDSVMARAARPPPP